MPRFMDSDPLIVVLRAAERGEQFVILTVVIEAAAVVGCAQSDVGSDLRSGE
jgi:hypothetical protein